MSVESSGSSRKACLKDREERNCKSVLGGPPLDILPSQGLCWSIVVNPQTANHELA